MWGVSSAHLVYLQSMLLQMISRSVSSQGHVVQRCGVACRDCGGCVWLKKCQKI